MSDHRDRELLPFAEDSNPEGLLRPAEIDARSMAAPIGMSVALPAPIASAAHAVHLAALGGTHSSVTSNTIKHGAQLAAGHDLRWVDSPQAMLPGASHHGGQYGNSPFDGASRWLDIGVNLSGNYGAPLLAAGDGAREGHVAGIVSETGTAHASVAQQIDLTVGAPVPVTSQNGLSYAIPSAFYQSLQYGFSTGAGGFSVYGGFKIAGGIKGSLSLGFGNVTPDYKVEINPQTVGSVQDGQIYTIDPTLVQTDDAHFSLSLPVANLALTYGLEASAGITLATPSVDIGVTIFGHFIGYTLHGPKLSFGFPTLGTIQTLGQDVTANLPGGYIKLAELLPNNFTSPSASTTAVAGQYGGLPTLLATGVTSPFIQAKTDLIAAIAQYVPELQILDGSKSFGIGSASWSLLSLPLTASLSVAESLSLTPTYTSVDIIRTIKGKSTDLGTHPFGQKLTQTGPATGSGAIDLKLSYSMTLTAQAALSLFGAFGINLNGPAASASIAGIGFGFSSLFSVPLYNKSGSIGPSIQLPSTTVTLTGTQTDIILYGPTSQLQVLTQNRFNTYSLGAGGERFQVNSGVTIAASSVGVIGTLGPGAVYNLGVISDAASSLADIGIDLVSGGIATNSGIIKGVAPSSGGFGGAGILMGGTLSSVVNTGQISGFYNGVHVKNGYVTNGKTGTITGIQNFGIDASSYGLAGGAPNATITNMGSISAQQVGIYLQSGGSIFNGATGHVHGGRVAVQSSRGGAAATLVNAGTINAKNISLYGSQSVLGVAINNGTVFNSGYIGGVNIAVDAGANGTSYVENSGTIVGVQNAVVLVGSRNTLAITPGASFSGGVIANYSNPKTNYLELKRGGSIGTVSGLGSKYQYFGHVVIAPNSAWIINGNQRGFTDSTISGLNIHDRLGISGLGFVFGETATLNTASDVLSIIGTNGVSVIGSIQLSGNFPGAVWQVTGNAGVTYVQEGPISEASIATSGIVLTPTGFYRDPLTIDPGVRVGYTSTIRPQTSFAIEAQKWSYTTTITTNGTASTITKIRNATITNGGTVAGNQTGIYLQALGTVENLAGATITAHGNAIYQRPGYAGAAIVNAGTIHGDGIGIDICNTGTTVNNGGTIVPNAGASIANKYGGVISGGVVGILLSSPGNIYNGGAIDSTTGTAIELNGGGTFSNLVTGVVNAAGFTSSAGVSVNNGYGVVTNRGQINGFGASGVAVSMSNGGFVSNNYTALTGTGNAYGDIQGTRYGVVITGGRGTVLNQPQDISEYRYLPFGGAFITGVSLGNGGTIVNGSGGAIFAGSGGKYGINTGSAGAGVYIANNGRIDSISAEGGDTIVSGPKSVITSIIGRTGATGSVLSIANAGAMVNTMASGSAISAACATTIINKGFDRGQVGIILSGGGTITNQGIIEGASGDAVDLLGGGALTNTGLIIGYNPTNAAVYLAGSGTISNSGTINAKQAGLFGRGRYDIVANGAGVSVSNSGTLFGARGIGVTGSGSVSNLAGGTIQANGSQATGYPTETGVGIAGGGSGLSVANAGVITAAYDGISLSNAAIITNTGSISGNTEGVYLRGGVPVNSGTIFGGNLGVYLTSGSLTNTGTISVGHSAAAGVFVNQGMLVNSGVISGGFYGAYLGNGTLVNHGTIFGSSGIAVQFGPGPDTLAFDSAAVFNGNVRARAAYTNTLELTGPGLGTLVNSQNGTFSGTFGGVATTFTGFTAVAEDAGANWSISGGSTLAALSVAGSLSASGNWSVKNGAFVTGTLNLLSGSIVGGAGADQYQQAGAGGLGVALVGGSLANAGLIEGGAGGYGQVYGGAGGVGLYLGTGTATNTGTIAGGTGGMGPFRYGGAGGVGVAQSGGVLTNFGHITGGTGGQEGMHGDGAGGAGVLMSGGLLTNAGTIQGGNAGQTSYYPRPGGDGVDIAGGTLVTSGFIGGGAGAAGSPGGVAVRFSGSGTLVLDPGATFGGAVVGMAGDALVLAGSTAATLSGLGTAFTGFSSLVVNAGAQWRLAGPATLNGSLTVNGALTLHSGLQATGVLVNAGGVFSGFGTVSAPVTNNGTVVAAAHHTLVLAGGVGGGGMFQVKSTGFLELDGGGVLNERFSGPGTLKLLGAWTMAAPEKLNVPLSIGKASSLSGAGVINGTVLDSGTISASGGTLKVAGAFSGAGALSAAAGATLDVAMGGSIAGALSGAGTLLLVGATSFATGAKLGAARIVAESDVTFATSLKLTNGLGNMLTLATSLGNTLHVSGTTASLTNQGTLLATGTGSAQVSVGVVNSGLISSSGAALQFLGALSNSGAILDQTGSIAIETTVTGKGTMEIGAGGTLTLDLGASVTQTVEMLGQAGVLDLGTPLDFAGLIGGFGGTDKIDLLNTASTSFSYASGALTVLNGAQTVASLRLQGIYTSNNFSLSSDGHGGTFITFH